MLLQALLVAVLILPASGEHEPEAAPMPTPVKEPARRWVQGLLDSRVAEPQCLIAANPPERAPRRPAVRNRTASATKPAAHTAARAMTTSAPASQPTIPAFQPLADARPGEWARYTAVGERALRYEVESVSGAVVRTRVQVTQSGKPLGETAFREDNPDLDPLARQARIHGAAREARLTRVDAAGRSWNAWLYEDHWSEEEIGYIRRTWVSEQVPVFGIIRMELIGDGEIEARLELTDCSTCRSSTRP